MASDDDVTAGDVEKGMRGVRKPGGGTRRANGIVSAVICLLFLPHGIVESLPLPAGVRSAIGPIAWAGVALCLLHIVLCIATSHSMLTDTVRPPSVRKRRHLWLKWATGSLLAVAALVHIGGMLGMWPALLSAPRLAMVSVLAALLVIHACVGAKSLLKDLDIDRVHRNPVRWAFAALGIASVVAATWSYIVG